MFDFIIAPNAALTFLAVMAFCYWQINDVAKAQRETNKNRK